MAFFRHLPMRNRKLQIAFTEELEQRLEATRKRCAERHMELPFQESFEAWLGRLLDDAEAELSGRLATPFLRIRRPPRSTLFPSTPLVRSIPPRPGCIVHRPG